jgi:hypothetical protein
MDYLYYLLWTRYVNEGGGALYKRSINFTALETVHPERLALIGVRYVIARHSTFNRPPALPRVDDWKGYGIYEVPTSNTTGYAASRLLFAKGLDAELRAMRDPSFDPKSIAIVAEADRERVGAQALSPILSSAISLQGNTLILNAESAGKRSFAVLPFRFSNCFRPTWHAGSGEIFRTDMALIGVLFSGRAFLALEWTGGYGAYDCLRKDSRLVHEATQAARDFRE